MNDYDSEIVTRCAPRWVWDYVDDLLQSEMATDNNAKADKADAAMAAMIAACEEG